MIRYFLFILFLSSACPCFSLNADSVYKIRTFKSGYYLNKITYYHDSISGNYLWEEWTTDSIKTNEARFFNHYRQGLSRQWNDKGELITDIHYIKGIPDGTGTLITGMNGDIIAELTFKNGKVDGNVTTYYSLLIDSSKMYHPHSTNMDISHHNRKKGKLMSQGEYIDNQPQGYWEHYFRDGSIHFKGYVCGVGFNFDHWDEMPRRDPYPQFEVIGSGCNEYTEYYENGKLKEFKNKDSLVSYYPNRKIKQKNYRDTVFYSYDSLGNLLSHYDHSKKTYIYQFFFPGTSKLQKYTETNATFSRYCGYYENGDTSFYSITEYHEKSKKMIRNEFLAASADGKLKYFTDQKKYTVYLNGIKYVRRAEEVRIAINTEGKIKVIYISGVYNDTCYHYYDSGKLQSAYYNPGGKPEGHYKSFYENGTILSDGTYENGKLNGLYSEYHSNGSIKTTGNYSNNQREGTWYQYNQYGDQEMTFNYKKGNMISSKRQN